LNHQSTVSKELNHQSAVSKEFKNSISSLNPKKSSGYDLITGKILKELAIIGIKYLTHDVLLKVYFPAQWKVSEHQQLQNKSAATALNTVLASVHTRTTY
jgi:hypothetical protein